MVKGVLTASLSEIPRGTKELYETLRELATKLAAQKKLHPHEVSFTQRQIRELTGCGQTWLKIHLRRLVDLEYLTIHLGGIARSKGHYRLITSGPLETPDLSMIPHPEQMKQRMMQLKERQKN